MRQPATQLRLIWTWLRTDARRRAPSLLVLALLVAMAGGTVLAAVAGVAPFVIDYTQGCCGLPPAVSTFPPANDQILTPRCCGR